MKIVLLVGLLSCHAYGMRKSPSMYDFQAQGAHIQVYKVPEASWAPDCSYCKRTAEYIVISFNEFKFTYCKEHFRAAGYSATSVITDN